MGTAYEHYYVPTKSYWPIVGSVGLSMMAVGGANWLHGANFGHELFLVGLTVILLMMFGWFRDVVIESHQGLYSAQMDKSFRWGMYWFIFSEVMFFAAFFGVLFYTRHLTLPWLGGLSEAKRTTHELLWPHFEAVWPLLNSPNPDKFPSPTGVMDTWGLPAINTAILITSSITFLIAEFGLKEQNRMKLIGFLAITLALAWIFVALQAYEYYHAYHELHLTMHSGIYGSTFFMLTGFHGAHVTLGSLMILVILLRCIKGHFTPEKHFGIAAVSWYWHFVDVVWLFLFVFVYWI